MLQEAVERLQKRVAPRHELVNIIEELDACFEDDWEKRKADIVSLVGRMGQDRCLLRFLVAELAARGRWPRITGAQTFMIYISKDYYIRINLWYPKRQNDQGQDKYRKYLSIEECHNHTYNFFTSTIFGPGYTSTFFEGAVEGKLLSPGNPVELTNRRDLSLPEGEVLFVRRDIDFHIQHWPTAFTITVNLVPINARYTSDRQYIVDERRGVVEQAISATGAI